MKSDSWQVSPICNDDQGCFLYGSGADVTGVNWSYLPADIVEAKVRFTFSYTGVSRTGSALVPSQSQLVDEKAAAGGLAGGSPSEANEEEFLSESTANAIDSNSSNSGNSGVEGEQEQEELSAERSSAAFGLDSQMLKWRDSNHECALFSNATHSIFFLSFNPKKLRSNMHPLLLKHLESNNINVGEDLQTLTASHWLILSCLTG
jgi:hypothetical protein